MTWIEQLLQALTTNAVLVSLHDANGVLLGAAQTTNFVQSPDDCNCVQNENAVSFTFAADTHVHYVKAFVGSVEYAREKLNPGKTIKAGCVFSIGIGEFKICYGCE